MNGVLILAIYQFDPILQLKPNLLSGGLVSRDYNAGIHSPYRGIYVDQMGLFLGVHFGDFWGFSGQVGAVYVFFKSDFQTYLSQVQILVLDRTEPSSHLFDVLSW